MMKRPDDRLNSNPDDEPLDEGGSTFAWEFVNDEHVGRSPSTSPRHSDSSSHVSRRRGSERRQEAHRTASSRKSHPSQAVTQERSTTGRGAAIREQLDRALDRWWARNEMPPVALLRDGLLLLEAGGTVSESQRTLLLRAALAYDRGVQTALRHQADAERVALVLAEALTEWEIPLAPEHLPDILASDAKIQPALVAELERSRVLLTGEARQRAQSALEMLPWILQGRSPMAAPATRGARARRPLRQVLFLLLLFAMLGFVIWQQRRTMTPAEMVAMPSATYPLVRIEGQVVAQEPTPLEGFFMDRFEVTNREYRSCVEQGACLWPVQTASATRANYFTDPAFDGYPVVNVTQGMAADYCRWRGKRLPSAAEWQGAASVAPTTGQPFRFPWGERFDPQRTNSARLGLRDTVVVGSFRPGGDSLSGASDMAGNVAEWTATLVAGAEPPNEYAVVKGGSFASEADALAAGAETQVAVGSATPEVGFRCTRTRVPG
ncbi:MAG: SUMF1/EgtB/PvdO family nonheme iron enzyme [Caldilineaceae bacterium]|nr:SUMF1/EgtB/PvdO family nonheme iron enzyme [Caldilineaceae bacterium]